MPEAEIEAMTAKAASGGTVEVWPENVETIRLFLSVMTQFRRDTSSGLPTGLDYNGVEAGFKMMRERVSGERFRDLQILESAYIAEIHLAARDQNRGAEQASSAQMGRG